MGEVGERSMERKKTIALARFHALTALVLITMFQRSVALGIIVLRKGEGANRPATKGREASGDSGSTTIKVWNFYLKRIDFDLGTRLIKIL